MVLNTMTKEVYRRKSGSIVVSEDEKRGHQGSRIRKLRVYIFKLRYEEEKVNWKWRDTLISTPTTSQICLSASIGHQGLPKYHQPSVHVPETMGHISNTNYHGSFISKGPHIDISKVICKRNWSLFKKRMTGKVEIKVQKAKATCCHSQLGNKWDGHHSLRINFKYLM